MKKNQLFLIICSLILPIVLTACLPGDGDNDNDTDSSTCSNLGAGEQPLSGLGTELDPYVISLNTEYGGCAVGEADPGPRYQITVPAGVYTISQTNGTTDLELWVYDENGNLLLVIDDRIAGFDESGTFSVDAGIYQIEVFSNVSDGPFTLEVF